MRISFILLTLCCAFCFSCQKTKQSTTLSGYVFEHHIKLGGRQPKAGDHAYFHAITMVGDSILENTHVYPFIPTMRIEVNPDREVAAIVEALEEMGIGDSITLHIPIDSLPFAPESFQSFKEIKHILSLVDIKDEVEFKKDMDVRQAVLNKLADSLASREASTRERLLSVIREYNEKRLDDKLQTTAEGVKYMIIKEGTGEVPKTGDMVEVNYVGGLTNEMIFEASFSKGQPYVYRLNTRQVIKGWDNVIEKFNEGTEAFIMIPPALGYGAAGSSPNIPPDSELIFYINLFKIRRM
ncbi:MAG: FKBP-type peptidyl-prolyl cis-trans isomerase [Saprospiraceae bacterium]|nr:FKBP-type peptidyl-prolyl cis-trans isomerase [Saprospiraceae bacterium]